MTDSERFEWVQITEPRSKEFLYINLTTGECLWEVPTDISYKKSDDTEWWELFDTNSSRFYYYNAKQQKTVWHRPDDCDIIPLAKLQTLKCRNIDYNKGLLVDVVRKEISTQTVTQKCKQSSPVNDVIMRGGKETTSRSSSVTDNANVDKRGSCSESCSSRTDNVDNKLEDANTKQQQQHNAIKPRLEHSSQQPNILDEVESEPGRTAAITTQQGVINRLDPGSGKNEKPKSREVLKGNNRSMSEDVRRAPRTVSRHSSDLQWPSSSAEIASCSNSISDDNHMCSTPAIYMNRSEHQTPLSGRCSFHGFAQEAGVQPGADTSAHVATFQITPTVRPRAFPRTNPSYVGTYRRDRVPTFKRVDMQPLGFGVGNFDQSWKPVFDFTSCMTSSNGGIRRPISDGAVAVQQGVGQNVGSNVFWSPSGQSATHQPFHSTAGSDAAIRSNNYNHRPHSDGIVVPRYSTSANNGHISPANRTVTNRENTSFERGYVDVESDVMAQQTRRKSEPDYVNVARNANRHSNASFADRTDSVPGYMGLQTGALGRLSPNAVYVNQQDLASTAFSSRSACSFLEPVTDGLPEFDFDDSDRSSIYSTPSPQSRHFQTLAPASIGGMSRTQAALSSYHPSLRKKKWCNRQSSAVVVSGNPQNAVDKNWSLQTEMTYHRPISLMSPYSPEVNVIANKVAGTLLQQMHIEQFVVENLNEHRKGILGKTVSVAHMLSWTKDVIQKPMIRTGNKIVKKEAAELFRLIQSYMGDRKAKESPLQLALEIAVQGWSVVDMRDEIYIQLCRQTTRNPREDSTSLGWELIGISLAFFPPSAKFYSYLEGHISKNIDSYSHICKSPVYQYATSCQKRLQWVVQVGAKRGLKKPNIEEVQQAKISLIEPSMFGSTLSDIMLMQRERFPERRLPWIQTTLSEEILRLGGMQTEGIFRIPGDIDEVNMLKVRCDRWIPPSTAYSFGHGVAGATTGPCDPHVPASLLKLWYRELTDPLIPSTFYDLCLDAFMRPDDACAVVQQLPDINRLTLKYLIRFLQGFIRPEVVQVTKMDVNNIAMVWAPNCLRGQSADPKIIFENTRREMGFVRTLIRNLCTDEAQDLL